MNKQEIISIILDQAPDSAADEILSLLGAKDALLSKYIKYIKDVEGVNYITDLDERAMSDVKFTDEEWGFLKQLAK